MTHWRIFLCVIICFTGSGSGLRSAQAQLPQDYPYQVVLRDYIATLSTEDFVVPLSPVLYDANFFTSTDELHATWILLENYGRHGALDMNGVRVAPHLFTLSQIERDGQVYMVAGRNSQFMDPINTAWWATWDYEGNPYYDSRAVKLRAFVAAAIDMIMSDRELEVNSTIRRSDYVGGYLTKFAYTYHVVKEILPEEVQAAYEEGLLKFFERIESYHPYGTGGTDMEGFQLPGLWYAAEAIDSDDLRARARAHTLFVLEEIMVAEGYHHRHGREGIDLSYEGILQHFLSWAALIYDDPEITEYLEKSARLKAHQTLPEPSGAFISPSNFNTGTAKGSANDQWHSYQRDHAVAMLTDEAKYLVWGGRRLPDWYFQGVPSEAEMHEEIERAIYKRNIDTDVNAIWAWVMPSPNEPDVWRPEHWIRGLPAAYTYYPTGFYDKLQSLAASGSKIVQLPILREETYIETFADAFVIARMEGYGAIIHTGPTVASWASGVPGLSGGGLSAFWTEDTGTIILGRSRGTQNADFDQWTGERGWETWAVHTISGVNAAGKPFSSARHRIPEVTREITEADTAKITIRGSIGQHDEGRSAPDNSITGVVNYSREFSFEEKGLKVTSTITSDETDQVAELWDMIPVFISTEADGDNDAIIQFYEQGEWIEATPALHAGVTAIRSTRFGNAVAIYFESPRRVKLSADVWSSSKTTARVRNVMVDMLDAESGVMQMPAIASVQYRIMPVSSFVSGDTSGDGIVSALDASNILLHLINTDYLQPPASYAADVSGDGSITAYDASLILQYIVGLINCMPAACN